MIVRFVKMTFHDHWVDDFEVLFWQKQTLISRFSGCRSVELLRSISTKEKGGTIYFTRSIWDSEEDLNNYRSSELFKSTWASTKALFSDRPEAWTLEIAL